MASLSPSELAALVRSVFPGHPEDRSLALLVDVPRSPERDNAAWAKRRALAAEWFAALREAAPSVPLDDVRLAAYADTGSNNADLPAEAFLVEGPPPSVAADLPSRGERVTMTDLFARTRLFLAPTEFSTTAPLKVAARTYGFRAATMPGFSEEMIPALRLDYGEVGRRVARLKDLLERASRADVDFEVAGMGKTAVAFDLRHRPAHESAGRFPARGTAGNLPSGEAYIVPYEGERAGDPSRTAGVLPVQVGAEVVLYTIRENTAVRADGAGPAAAEEDARLRREPAYGNMAELGFGVLGDFGLKPIGETLLDEKLGLHVALGRSDHFGGRVGPKDFSTPAAVVHLDRIYIPEAQPRVKVASVRLAFPDGASQTIMEKGKYKIF